MMEKNMKKYVAAGVAVVAVAVAGIGCVVSARAGKVKVPFSSNRVVGESVDEVKDELEAAGFQDIELVSSTAGWLGDHEVLAVTIDSKTDFRNGSYHRPEEAVVITYSSDERKDAKTALNGWESMKYKAYYDALLNAGFTNVSTVELETEEYQLNHRIASVNVNGEDYTQGACYLPVDAPIIISYYKAQLEVGRSAEAYIGENYKKVVKELEEKGFSEIETEPVTTGWADENAVLSITVGGEETFDSKETFSSDTKISIRYSSDYREDMTAVFNEYNSQMYQDLKINLSKQGFMNLKYEGIETNDKALNQLVEEVVIDGETFHSGECYLDKNAEILIKYYTLTVNMPESESAYIKEYKNDTTELENELRKIGFVNIEIRESNDLITGWLNKEGTIRSISIDGKEKFQKGDSYSYEASVVITVNTYRFKR